MGSGCWAEVDELVCGWFQWVTRTNSHTNTSTSFSQATNRHRNRVSAQSRTRTWARRTHRKSRRAEVASAETGIADRRAVHEARFARAGASQADRRVDDAFARTQLGDGAAKEPTETASPKQGHGAPRTYPSSSDVSYVEPRSQAQKQAERTDVPSTIRR